MLVSFLFQDHFYTSFQSVKKQKSWSFWKQKSYSDQNNVQ